jgi:tRNA A-37 threonylcarbamoyl transferase component Bud32
MREQGLPEALHAGYRLIRTRNGFIVAKEGYAEAFSTFTLPGVTEPDSSGHRSGRGSLVSIPLAERSSERALVRRYIRGGFLGRFSRELFLDIGQPRPLKELKISDYARRAGISTPEVLAAVVEKVNGFFYRGALVTREINPAADLQEEALRFAPKDRPAVTNKRRCIGSLGRLIARMHGAGIYHADLHLKNILKAGEELYVLDLDAADIRNPLPEYKKRMNLLRLYRSAEKINRRRRVITRTDLLRFTRSYAAEMNSPESALLKDLLRMLPLWRVKWRLSDLLKI